MDEESQSESSSESQFDPRSEISSSSELKPRKNAKPNKDDDLYMPDAKINPKSKGGNPSNIKRYNLRETNRRTVNSVLTPWKFNTIQGKRLKVSKNSRTLVHSGLKNHEFKILLKAVDSSENSESPTSPKMVLIDNFDCIFNFLVVNGSIRTPKVLFALAGGAMIVDFSWAEACEVCDDFLPMIGFEHKKFPTLKDRSFAKN